MSGNEFTKLRGLVGPPKLELIEGQVRAIVAYEASLGREPNYVAMSDSILRSLNFDRGKVDVIRGAIIEGAKSLNGLDGGEASYFVGQSVNPVFGAPVT